MTVDLHGCDQAGLAAIIARERRWRVLWQEAQTALDAEREKRRLLEEQLERFAARREP